MQAQSRTTTFHSPVKAPETQKIECLLWIRELQCTMLSKENGAQTQWILWQGPKHRKRLAAIGSSADERVSTSFCSWSRSVRNSAITRWNASNSLASSALVKTLMFIWVENDETPQLAQIVKTLACTMDDAVLLVVSRLSSCSSSIFVFNIEIKGSVWLFQKIENIVRSSDNSKWQACMRETVKQQTRRTRKIQRKAFLFGYSPSQWIWRTWRHLCSHIPLKERTQIRKVMLQKWRHKNGSTVFMLNCAKTKRDLFCEQKYGGLKTAEHKVLNEGRESRNNNRYAVVVPVLATQWNPCQTKTSQETEKTLRKILKPSQKPKVIHTYNLLEFGKYCEELSWNHRTTTLHRSETSGTAEWAVRRAKEETSAVLLQSGSDDKWWSDSLKCCCNLRDDQKLPGRWEISKMNEDLENLSMRCFVRGEKLGRRCSDCWDWRIEMLDASESFPRRLNGKESLDNPERWKFCISCGRWFSKIVRKRLRIPRTHSETGNHREERESQRRISWR